MCQAFVNRIATQIQPKRPCQASPPKRLFPNEETIWTALQAPRESQPAFWVRPIYAHTCCSWYFALSPSDAPYGNVGQRYTAPH